MSEEQASIQILKKQKKIAKSALTKISNYVEQTDFTEVGVNTIRGKLDHFEQAFKKFESSYLELSVKSETKGDEAEFYEVEKNYYEVKHELQDHLSNKNVAVVKKVESRFRNEEMDVKVPKIEIGKFKGEPDQWLKFYESFKTIIHSNNALPKLKKFHYLITCLDEEASDTIEGIEVSEENYEFAWETLVNRYKNNKNLIITHIGNLFNTKKVENQNSSELRELHNIFLKNLNSLKKLDLKFDSNGSDAFLLYLLTTKLDKVTLKEWEMEYAGVTEIPSYEDLIQFLTNRYSYLESFEKRQEINKPRGLKEIDNKVSRRKAGMVMLSQSTKNCVICNGNEHPVYRCYKFLKEGIAKRREIIKKLNCCWQCFQTGHRVSTCTSRVCSHCQGRHNYLICEQLNKQRSKTDYIQKDIDKKDENKSASSSVNLKPNSQESNNSSTSKSYFLKDEELNVRYRKQYHATEHNLNPLIVKNKISNFQINNVSHKLIPTVLADLLDNDGKPHLFRFILDTGSELNFLTKNCSNKLGLPSYNENIRISGIDNITTNVNEVIYTEFKSKTTNFSTRIKFHLVNEINDSFEFNEVNTKNLPDWLTKNLADNTEKQGVDGILGVGIFFRILKNNTYFDSMNKLSFRKTALGWIMIGNNHDSNSQINSGCFHSNTEDTLMIPHRTKGETKVIEEEQCETIFLETVKRDSDGRFIVNLPMKENFELGNTLNSSIKRFFNLERKLERDATLKREYVEFLKEYENLGHMEKVPYEELQVERNYYLPHHPVLRCSQTTKLRVVFDASHKSDNGFSLNDTLLVGRKLQNDLFSLLIGFRKFKFGLMGDIEKMYRQIKIEKTDADLQRIVWRKSPTDPLIHFRLKTVTYGTNSAPFLAIRCLHRIAELIIDQEPDLANIIKTKFYMDDLILGADSIEELKELQVRIRDLLREYGFPMRKWCTNAVEAELLNSSDPHFYVNLDKTENTKALGLLWNPRQDVFEFEHHSYTEDGFITKRKIISELQSFWDPIGLWVPLFIKGKIFVREVWEGRFDWDEPLPSEIQDKWLKFRKDLELLNKKWVPRRILAKEEACQVVLHGFADASNKAIGCCIYALSKDSEGRFSSSLICAKGRVAPQKTESLPRLELLGALMLAKLMEKTVTALEYNHVERHYWSDSEIVLTWLRGFSSQWKTYVANRVQIIQNLTEVDKWHHIGSKDNPADLASRGVKARDFLLNKLWWEGPIDRMINPVPWRGVESVDLSEKVIEKRKMKFSLLTIKEWSLIDRYSSWKKLLWVTAWIFRFIKNCRSPKDKRYYSNLSSEELMGAKLYLIKEVQNSDFSQEISRLERNKQIKGSSKLASLAVFIDKQGLLRVGGRLNKALISESRKHPIVLPYKHKLTELIIRDIHLKHFHIGPQALLSTVRGEYWPLKGKSATKSIVHSCVICKRANAKLNTQMMASLPLARISPSRPFENTGVDFCGPFYIRANLKKSVLQKVYVAIFICFATKAIHLELVSDLSSDAFLAALFRFFSRRGMSRNIYSDNGTNFVGAQKELKGLINDSRIKQKCLEHNIEWHFIPAGSPHFGGLWESAVKLFKNHFRKVLHNNIMNFEEMYTVMTRIEACLNSRPLTPLSDNPNDPSPLTPSHFLVGDILILPNEPDFTNMKLFKRWQRVKQISQEFWKRWSREYLSSLQQRNKWRFPKNNIPLGTLVTIRDEGLKPLQWKLGRVVQLHCGDDGMARVATVKTSSGEIRRPVVKLCPILED